MRLLVISDATLPLAKNTTGGSSVSFKLSVLVLISCQLQTRLGLAVGALGL